MLRHLFLVAPFDCISVILLTLLVVFALVRLTLGKPRYKRRKGNVCAYQAGRFLASAKPLDENRVEYLKRAVSNSRATGSYDDFDRGVEDVLRERGIDNDFCRP